MAQSIRYDGNLTTSETNVPYGAQAPVFTVPNGIVTVYTDVTLTALAAIFADAALTVPAPNPMVADTLGRYGFWTNVGGYYYTVTTALGIVEGTYPLTLMGVTGGQGPPGPTSTTTYNGSNGPFQVNGNLGGKSIVGELMASGYQSSPNASDGLTLALAAIPNGGSVQIDPAYTGSDAYPEIQQVDAVVGRSLRYPAKTIISDKRVFDAKLAHNLPGLNRPAYLFNSRKDDGDPSTNAVSLNAGFGYYVGGPGSYHAQGNETVAKNLAMFGVYASKGIHQNENINVFKYGCGDFGPRYQYSFSYGGAINGDDEGHTGEANYVTEGDGSGRLPVKVITGTFQDATGVTMFTLQDGPNSSGNEIGAGRMAVRVRNGAGTEQIVTKFTVTGSNYNGQNTYSTLTIAESLPANLISAAYGLSDPFTVPPNQDIAQVVTVGVQIQGGVRTSGFTVGMASMNGPRRNEHVLITAVTPVANSRQTLTILVRTDPGGISGGPQNYPQSQAYFFQDQQTGTGNTTMGLSQTVLRFACWNKTDGNGNSNGTYGQNIPLCGAIDAHTVVYAGNTIQQRQPIPGYDETVPQTQGVQVGRINNFLWIRYADKFYNNPELVISGCSDPSLNVAGTMVYTGQIYGGDKLLGFPNNGPDTSYYSPLSATVTVGAGRNVCTVYQAAEVIRVSNPAATVDAHGTVFGVESTDIAFANGDVIEFPGHYSTGMKIANEGLTTLQPTNSGITVGRVIAYSGPSVDYNFSGLTLENDTPANQYSNQGGFRGAPAAILIKGPHRSAVQYLDVSPQARFFFLRSADPNNPASAFTFVECDTLNSNAQLQIDPYNDQFAMQMANGPGYVQKKYTGSPVDPNGQGYGGTHSFSNGPVQVGNQQIKQVGKATDAADAVNLQQLQAAVPAGLSTTINFPGNAAGSQNLTFTNGVLTARS